MPPKATSRCGIWHHDLFRFAFVSGASFLSVAVTPLLQGPWCSWISDWNTNSQSLTISMRRFCIVLRIRFLPGYVSILHCFAQRSYVELRTDFVRWGNSASCPALNFNVVFQNKGGKNSREIFQKAWRCVWKENGLFEKSWECETFRVLESLIDRIVEISGMQKVNIRN